MKTAEQWYVDGGLNNDAAEIQHRREIQADALRDAAEMHCVNHVPGCNCDVCAFKKRILRAAMEL